MNIWCIKCDEAVTHDGETWIACHCYGCNESEESQYPEQWVVSKELPTRSELLARIQELETAGRPFAHPDLCKRLPNNGASSDEQAVIFVRNNAVITLADCKRIAALLNNTPLEKE